MTDRDGRRGQVTVEDRQGVERIGPERLARLGKSGSAALGLIRERGMARDTEIAGAAVFLVDDAGIGAVHGEFFGDPSATDVITFPLGNYGEILVSAETARRQGEEYGSSFDRELTLYIVHGLLHLHGHEDVSAEGRALMGRLQGELLGDVFLPPGKKV